MNGTIKVKGGNPLIGEVTPVANKNSILPALAASVLTNQTVIYKQVPQSTDVDILLKILKKLGAQIDSSDYNNLKITCKNINTHKIDEKLGGRLRSSLFLAGPLLARVGKVEVPTPGGCVLGVRSMSAHLDSFKKVGIKVSTKTNAIILTAPTTKKKEYRIWQVEASVSATENLFLYLAGINAKATVIDAASEPHVKNLCEMLENMGAKIKGKGSNKVTIKGNKNLSGTTFVPYPDHVDISTLMVAAAITKGNITIKGANIGDISDGLIQWYEKFNMSIEKVGKDLRINQKQDLKLLNTEIDFPLAGTNLPKFVPRPWPGYPVDCLPMLITLATKTKGRILVQNWMYETGLDFIRHLNVIGASIYMTDPQKVIIEGPTTYKGGEVYSPGIIQATMAIFLASLSDKATTVIHNADTLKRRYPEYVKTFKKLGAEIKIINT